MKRRKTRSGGQKERMGIIAASVFVLSALTLTGVYMSAQDDSSYEKGKEENKIDFAKLEQQKNANESEEHLSDNRYTDNDDLLSDNNDMDIDPAYTAANSGNVENTKTELNNRERFVSEDDIPLEETLIEQTTENLENVTVQEETTVNYFGEGDTLKWPIVGEILLDYSMDRAIYFPTMQQYRYNPSIVIAAEKGETITAAANATVEKIYYDAKTGNSVRFDLGNGYKLVYGQLEDIVLEEGQQVKAGDIVGNVAAPTIYYSEEGTNVYFALTKDGEPVNPLEQMQ